MEDATASPLQLDVVSDFVCPWCWVGKRQLDAALKEVSRPVATVWRAYQLDPAVPQEGVEYHRYMKAKFASPEAQERVKAMRAHLEALGAQLGLGFDFDALTIRPNTAHAHRLQRWATGQGLGDEMAETLFAAYFVDGRNLGSVSVLADCAGQVGMDSRLVAELLATDRDAAVLEQEEASLRAMGVSGVPTLIAGQRRAISGAQGVDVFARFLAA